MLAGLPSNCRPAFAMLRFSKNPAVRLSMSVLVSVTNMSPFRRTILTLLVQRPQWRRRCVRFMPFIIQSQVTDEIVAMPALLGL